MTGSSRTVATAALVLGYRSLSPDAFVPSVVFPVTPPSISSTFALSMSKNSDRARAEKNFEDMMGNDWKAFRAKLVMQEKMEAQSSPGNGSYLPGYEQDAKLARQERLGNVFASVTSSILFPNGKSGFGHNGNEIQVDRAKTNRVPSIFNRSLIKKTDPPFVPPPGCTDPFVSQAEIPALIPANQDVALDQKRWAHSIPGVEPGCILVANERLGGVFRHTVLLVVKHHEGTGTTAIVINRPLNGNLIEIASDTPSNLDLSLKLAFSNATVTYGGPVMEEEYSILHGYGEVEGSQKVSPGVFVGGSFELMHEVRRDQFHPDEALFVKGQAVWLAGQLSLEIAKGVWYPASASSDFILRYAGANTRRDDYWEDLWIDILSCMGGKYAEIACQHAGRMS